MRPRDETKIQAIRSTAIEMIAKEGLENFGINKLARAVGVSPATIYIYYADKDALLNALSVEEGLRMTNATLEGLDPEMPFEQGLWIQWQNRARYAMNNQLGAKFFEQLRSSTYRENMLKVIGDEMKKRGGGFVKNAVKRGEINEMPLEVFWSIAFSPLYSLVRFHHDGQSLGGRKFTFSEKIMKETFNYVLKALKK
jgi:TetR/AcrR family transcriptional regulator, multidrug resistance operon repressor